MLRDHNETMRAMGEIVVRVAGPRAGVQDDVEGNVGVAGERRSSRVLVKGESGQPLGLMQRTCWVDLGLLDTHTVGKRRLGIGLGRPCGEQRTLSPGGLPSTQRLEPGREMRHVPGDRPRGLGLQAFGKRLEKPEGTDLIRAQTPQLPLRRKRVELRGPRDKRHLVDLWLDQPDRATDSVCRSKNAGVQRGLDVAEESGHGFVRL